MDRWMNGYKDKWLNEEMDRRMSELRMGSRVDGWIDE